MFLSFNIAFPCALYCDEHAPASCRCAACWWAPAAQSLAGLAWQLDKNWNRRGRCACICSWLSVLPRYESLSGSYGKLILQMQSSLMYLMHDLPSYSCTLVLALQAGLFCEEHQTLMPCGHEIALTTTQKLMSLRISPVRLVFTVDPENDSELDCQIFSEGLVHLQHHFHYEDQGNRWLKNMHRCKHFPCCWSDCNSCMISWKF